MVGDHANSPLTITVVTVSSAVSTFLGLKVLLAVDKALAPDEASCTDPLETQTIGTHAVNRKQQSPQGSASELRT